VGGRRLLQWQHGAEALGAGQISVERQQHAALDLSRRCDQGIGV
jgi:hypothetical protein